MGVSTRWWAEATPGKDEVGLFVVRYDMHPEGWPVSAQYLTETGWVEFPAGEVIRPLVTVNGMDAAGMAFARRPEARKEMADLFEAAVADVLVTALGGAS